MTWNTPGGKRTSTSPGALVIVIIYGHYAFMTSILGLLFRVYEFATTLFLVKEENLFRLTVFFVLKFLMFMSLFNPLYRGEL